jgi:hypothetical protein
MQFNGFVDVLARVIETLIYKLETRFQAHGVKNVFGIVYPQY